MRKCPPTAYYRLNSPPAAALAGSQLQRSAAEPDLVSVGIAVRDLAHTVGVGFPLHGVESPISYLCDERIEVIDEARVQGVASVLRSEHNEHVPMLRKLPHGLCVVWEECGRGAQQPFVPRERRRVVGDWDSREQVEIRGMNHSSCSFLLRSRDIRRHCITHSILGQYSTPLVTLRVLTSDRQANTAKREVTGSERGNDNKKCGNGIHASEAVLG